LTTEAPPLARGGLRRDVLVHVPGGSTPARAGRTDTELPEQPRFRKHPRSRGEDPSPPNPTSSTTEAPPLARGGRHRRSMSSLNVGSTPARAGRTHRLPTRPHPLRKHSRSRGEDASTIAARRCCPEAPPLARGGLPQVEGEVRHTGSTPARAGRTTSWAPCTTCPWKHPRSRGEDFRATRQVSTLWEAPPLARGGRCCHHQPRPATGSTPARAGRTAPPWPVAPRAWKHPRSRGEDARHTRPR